MRSETDAAFRFHRLLSHPLTRGRDINHPSTTSLRRTIVQSKPFVRRIYDEWYRKIASHIPSLPGQVLEVGSGAGFLADYVPDLITSEVFSLPGIRCVLDGVSLPFAGGSLKGIVMTNVLHHIQEPSALFAEAQRCLRPGGAVILVEPWVSRWSRVVYTRLHHEPFLPEHPGWSHSLAGPLSGANGALPWIILQRDRQAFEAQFPDLAITKTELLMPFRYLVSGGVTMRSLMPGITFRLWELLETGMKPWMDRWAMFALVVVEKRERNQERAISAATPPELSRGRIPRIGAST
jgi:SAM-dependent methyltransferase